MKSLIDLYHCVLVDLGRQCGVSTTRDWETVTRRSGSEGLSFFTMTLPAYCKDFERCLAEREVSPSAFLGFSRCGGLPRFLRGFLGLIFDPQSGQLLDNPDPSAVRCVRQACLLLSKLEMACTERRTRFAMAQYVETDEEVAASVAMYSSRLPAFSRMSRVLWGELFSRVESLVYSNDLWPQHSAGATADRLRGNAKYDLAEWTDRLDDIFPVVDYLAPNARYAQERLVGTTVLPRDSERPVRVIPVPKTAKTPRIIAVEPTCMQYVQHGLLNAMTDEFAKDAIASWLVDASSQEPNRELARRGSVDGSLATLDLSEASDRVSVQHVIALTALAPWLRRGLMASRSVRADVPGQGIITLAKFASMGSAVCFPVEALVFATVVFMGIESALGRPMTRNDVMSMKGQVRVYGDDIIVPTHFASAVTAELEAFGFRVNVAKSFWTGNFRESCGAEWFVGRPVSVVRARDFLPSSRRDVSRLVRAVALRNHLFGAGYESSVEWLDERISALIPFPVVEPTSPMLGRHSWSGAQPEATSRHLQQPVAKGCVVVETIPPSKISGVGALMKHFLKRGGEPFADRRHLERSGRACSAHLKTGWYPIR